MSLASLDDFAFLLTSLKDELAILGRVLYKVRNQQRRTPSFKHLQAVLKLSRTLLATGGALTAQEISARLGKVRGECLKVGAGMWFNLGLNFFASYSAVVQAGVARIEIIAMRLSKLMERDHSSGEGL